MPSVVQRSKTPRTWGSSPQPTPREVGAPHGPGAETLVQIQAEGLPTREAPMPRPHDPLLMQILRAMIDHALGRRDLDHPPPPTHRLDAGTGTGRGYRWALDGHVHATTSPVTTGTHTGAPPSPATHPDCATNTSRCSANAQTSSDHPHPDAGTGAHTAPHAPPTYMRAAPAPTQDATAQTNSTATTSTATQPTTHHPTCSTYAQPTTGARRCATTSNATSAEESSRKIAKRSRNEREFEAFDNALTSANARRLINSRSHRRRSGVGYHP